MSKQIKDFPPKSTIADTDLLLIQDAVDNTYKKCTKAEILAGASAGTGGVASWQRKTANYLARNGDRLIADTTAGVWQLFLPTTPVVGDEINFIGLGTDINYLDVLATKFNNSATDKLQVRSNLKPGRLIYINSTIGWIEDPQNYFTVIYPYLLQDSFTDDSNKTLTAHAMEIGGGWLTSDANWKISSNKVITGGATGAGTLALANSGSANVSVGANITWFNQGVNSQQGLILRGIDSSNYLLLRYVFLTNNFRITQTVNGSQTDLASANVSVPSGSTSLLRFNAKGNILTGYLDGKEIITVNTTTLSTATRCGLWCYEQSNGFAASWDDFVVQTAP